MPDVQYIEQNADIYGLVEHTEIFEDVYPHRTGTVSGIDAMNPLVFCDDTMEFDLMEKNPPTEPSVYRYLLPGAKAKVHFQTGNLAGYEFELSGYNHVAKQFVMIPINEKFSTHDTGNNGAFALPNQVLKPAVGGNVVEYSNVILAGKSENSVSALKFEQYKQQSQIDGSTNLAAIANRRSSLIEDITSNYTTEISGGLILSTLMQMRGLEEDGSLKTNSGISGLTNEVNPMRFWAGAAFESKFYIETYCRRYSTRRFTAIPASPRNVIHQRE